MLYFIKRLTYDIFFKGSKQKKILLLILLLLLVLSPSIIKAEEVGGETSEPPTERVETEVEPLPTEPSESDPTGSTEPPTIIIETNNDEILEYLKEQEEIRKQQEEIIKQQEEEQALLLLEEQNARALTQSQNNIVYGFLNNYRYYVIGTERVGSSAYNQYIQHMWLIDNYPILNVENGNIEIMRGSCEYIRVDNESNVTYGECTNINNYKNYNDIYSNIKQLKYPSVYQIDKGVKELEETQIHTFISGCVLYIGFIMFNAVVNGPSGRKHI